MSDTTTGTRPDPDELASAYLDGELDEHQRAAVEADPALLARVDELATVRAAVAGPVAVAPPDVQAAALAAALDVHAQLWAPRPVPAPAKAGWWERLTARRLGPILAGATLVAVAAVGVTAVVNDDGSSGGGSDLAVAAPETTAAVADVAGGGTQTAAPDPAALAAAAAPVPDLGDVDGDELQPLLAELPPASEEVVAEVEATEATEATAAASDVATADAGGTSAGGDAPATTAAGAEPTAAPETAVATTAAAAAPPADTGTFPPVQARTAGATCPAPEGTVFYGRLEVEGAPAEVFVGTTRAVALAVEGCTVLAEVPLP